MSVSSEEKPSATPQALIESSKGMSKIWFIPIITLIVGLWFIFQEVNDQGVRIEIQFDTASGLEEGKTQIKIRDVVIGHVDTIRLNEDSTGVLVSAALSKDAEKYLDSDTRFWVVSPKISLAGVSGLQTLLSGSYIEMSPGVSGTPTRHFVALDNPPVTSIGTPGVRVFLSSEQSFTAQVGDPVIYRGLSVGRIETVEYDLEKRAAKYSAFIEAPFDQLVTDNTRFWSSSGIELELGVGGVGVSTSNLESLIAGGITFDDPEGMKDGQPVGEDKVFRIYPSYKNAMAHRFVEKVYYVILVENSVRGLTVGAPVEYRGLQIGQVEEINAKLENHKLALNADSYKIPVVISVQPGLANLSDDESGKELISRQLSVWVDNGLRASLKTGNLLTGAVYVDLQHYDDVQSASLTQLAGYSLIPTVPDQIVQFTDQLNTTLDKINALPLNGMATDLRTLLQDLASSAESFNDTSRSLTNKLDELDMQGINETLSSLNKLLANLSEEEQGVSSVNQTMIEIQEAIRELKPLLQKMNSAPNSLIFKSQVAPDIEPRGVNR